MAEFLPPFARVDDSGELWVGGCQASALAREFGTPLYVFDEALLRSRCQAYRRALQTWYPAASRVAYASKAYLNLALAQLFAQEKLWLDVVSAGELYVARQAGFPADRILFHGNNKTARELEMCLDAGVGRIVIDGFSELAALEHLTQEREVEIATWLRLAPGVDAHTHTYRKTGLLDSKFGFPLATGDAERALLRAMKSARIRVLGLHAHIGSQIYDVEPFEEAVEEVLAFASEMRKRHGFVLHELSPGGGWGVRQHEEAPPAPLGRYVRRVCAAVVQGARGRGLDLPTLILEPGRSIVAPAGVAIYRVGARKEIPGVRTYVAVDGGMGDNIRPALYGSEYTALAAEKIGRTPLETVTIAGRYCESGDILMRDVSLPRLMPGDLIAVPQTGAYCLPMASNYNLVPRPAVVLVSQQEASLIQRRETLEDLVMRDHPLPGASRG